MDDAPQPFVSIAAARVARRNLEQRIQRFFVAVGTGNEIAPLQATNLSVALTCLAQQRCADGEDAMMLAEKGWKPRWPTEPSTRSVVELRAELERLKALPE